jgi:hypothetical protein
MACVAWRSAAAALALNTRLLRTLVGLLPAAAAPQQQQQQQQQQVADWLLSWLQALSTPQLAPSGGAVKQDAPALLGALLPGGAAPANRRGGGGLQQQQQQGDAPPLLQPSRWLPLVAKAAAEAEEGEGSDADGTSDDDTDAEGACVRGAPGCRVLTAASARQHMSMICDGACVPLLCVRTCAGDQADGGSQGAAVRKQRQRKTRPAAKLALPPVVSALLAAAAQKQVCGCSRLVCRACCKDSTRTPLGSSVRPLWLLPLTAPGF